MPVAVDVDSDEYQSAMAEEMRNFLLKHNQNGMSADAMIESLLIACVSVITSGVAHENEATRPVIESDEFLDRMAAMAGGVRQELAMLIGSEIGVRMAMREAEAGNV